MGYNTHFEGSLTITPAVSVEDGNDYYTRFESIASAAIQGAPNSYCRWAIVADAPELKWNGAPKFYRYQEWLIYLVREFFAPRGYVLNGTIDWSGEAADDVGRITANNNELTFREGLTPSDTPLTDDDLDRLIDGVHYAERTREWGDEYDYLSLMAKLEGMKSDD